MASVNRREMLKVGAAALGSIWIGRSGMLAYGAERVVKRGRLKQSVSRWCYESIPLPEFSRAVVDMGLTAIDLLGEKDWEVMKRFGLTCSMGYTGAASIENG